MNTLEVAAKHAGFRNIVAHSPLPISTNPDGTIHIQGIMNFTPKDSKNIGQLVSLQELRERVDESADLTRQLLEMQSDFAPPTGG